MKFIYFVAFLVYGYLDFSVKMGKVWGASRFLKLVILILKLLQSGCVSTSGTEERTNICLIGNNIC